MSSEEEFSDDLVWAREVLLVYRNMGKVAGRRALGSSSAKALHEWASNPENMKDFYNNIVPKATAVISKYQSEDVSEVLKAEASSVADLQGRLRKALEAAKEVTPDSSPLDEHLNPAPPTKQ